VGAVSVVALAGYLVHAIVVWRRRSTRGDERRDYQRWQQVVVLVAGLLGVALLAVLWAPPLHQQLNGHPGNLSQLFDFFRGRVHGPVGAHHHPLGAALDAVAVTATQLPYGGDTAVSVLHGATTGQLALFWASGAVGVGAAAVAVWRRNLFALGLAAVSLVGMGAAVLAATHVVGPLYPYLMSWATYLALPAWLSAGWLMAGLVASLVAARTGRRAARRHAASPSAAWRWLRVTASGLAAAVLLVPPAALGYQLVAQAAGGRDDGDAAVGQLAAFARTALPPSASGRSPLVEINSGMSWPVAAGLVWQLEREGLHPRVTLQWGFMFGRNRVDRHVPPVVLALAATSTVPPALRSGPDVLTVNDHLYGPTTLLVTGAAPHRANGP
jgi:hypothetical protein